MSDGIFAVDRMVQSIEIHSDFNCSVHLYEGSYRFSESLDIFTTKLSRAITVHFDDADDESFFLMIWLQLFTFVTVRYWYNVR